MSLRIILDADIQRALIVRKLRTAGHDALTANEAGLRKARDIEIFHKAVELGRIVMTYNCTDFKAIHRAHPVHSGIIGVYKNTDYRKNMSVDEIVRALTNLETSGWELAGQFVSLNQWSY